MFNRLLSPRRDPFRQSLAEEVASLCRAQQIQSLPSSRHMRRDVGLDCGCLDKALRKIQL